MRFHSTRNPDNVRSAAEAIVAGLADDGGLFVPETFPRFDPAEFDAEGSLADTARTLLAPFLAGDALADALDDICTEAFDFPAPLVDLRPERLSVLELFHGPTAAFKDFGARFLAACLGRLGDRRSDPLTILVATSGDTGGAVAAAFHGRPGLSVDVFYPAGQVSPRQELQLTCWGDNVRAFRVDGRFDDCQALVKAVFQDEEFGRVRHFSSANSINLGRLLPQMVYYAWASIQLWQRLGEKPSFIVPTGNLGNALACVWARRAGLPIDRIHLATNANRTIADFLDDGEWRPRASVATLANAMDVGNPSNMERLRSLYTEMEILRDAVSASAVSDDEIAAQIRKDFPARGMIWCPHTATALHVYDGMSERERSERHWVAVATAHPAKFETIVEPLIGRRVDVPDNLARLLTRSSHKIELEAELAALRTHYVT